MKTFLPSILCAAVLAASLQSTQAIEPKLRFDFNKGTGTVSLCNGSNAVEAALFDGDKKPANLYSADAAGPTGKPGDFALNIAKTTTAMGANGKSGGVAKVANASGLLGSIKSFTVTGWFNASSTPDAAARLVEYTDPLNGGFTVAVGKRTLTLSLNKKMLSTPYRPDNCFNDSPESRWIFFAVTFDGAKTSDNVAFYGGTLNAQADLVSTQTTDVTEIPDIPRNAWIAIGNNGGGIRPFHGLLDNISIYCSAEDSSGALTLNQIREIHQANLAGK